MSILQKDFGEILKMAILLLKECVWIWLLAASKPVNRPGWWKGKFALIHLLATVGEGWQISVQRLTWQPPSTPRPQPAPFCQQPVGQEILQTEGGDYMQKQYLALTVIFKLVIWVVLGIVNLHFQGLFVPISLRPILGTVAAHVLGTVWSLCS